MTNKARTQESTINTALADVLRGMSPAWTANNVLAESTGVIREHAALKPDILIDADGGQPVVVETEFEPARTVEADAQSRLNKETEYSRRRIEAAVAVKLPRKLRGTSGRSLVTDCEFSYRVLTVDAAGKVPDVPETGAEWFRGGVVDIADAVDHCQVSEHRIAVGADALERAVMEGAQAITRLNGNAGSALDRILGQRSRTDDQRTQTARMATAMIASAFVFHTAIENRPGIPPVPVGKLATKKGRVLDAWARVLEVNYYPVFGIAREIVAALPTAQAGGILLRTSETAEILSDLGSTTYHELHGRLFQKLIADRKVLATFYTLPPSAAFLAEVAVSMLTTGRTGQSIDWSDPEMVGGLRITDPACGTGALLSAAQQAVYRRHRRAGGDDANIHRRMMEEGLTGIDVMPAAAHLSCAMLSCAHPNVDYRHARIAAAPFGETDVQGVQLGSLELMEHDSIHSLFPFGSGETVGPKGRREANIFVGPMSQDLVIMNPPFTRPTNHKGHGREDMPVPSFAGFGTDAYAQKAMSAKLKKQRFKAAAGNAGLASYFVELGMTKVRPGGVLACVIPFSGVQGHSYSKIRAMLDSKCDDVRIISIAAEREEDTAWSADTGMAEALVIAKRRAADGRSGSSRVHFATFPARPQTSVESKIRARGIDTASKVAQWKDSGIAGALDRAVIAAISGLAEGRLKLPRVATPLRVPTTRLRDVARVGPVDRDIIAPTQEPNTRRGPFTLRAVTDRGADPATIEWPMLWSHSASAERTPVVRPDKEGVPLDGRAEDAEKLWTQWASVLHANRDFRLNSQSLAMCLTPVKCLGGRAWPAVVPLREEWTQALLLWANSTPGMMAHWTYGTTQQLGRSCITVKRWGGYVTLDPRELSPEQLEQCSEITLSFEHVRFRTAHEAWDDDARKRLDRALLFGRDSVLGLPEDTEENLDVLRRTWCAEPSVRGGKAGPTGQANGLLNE